MQPSSTSSNFLPSAISTGDRRQSRPAARRARHRSPSQSASVRSTLPRRRWLMPPKRLGDRAVGEVGADRGHGRDAKHDDHQRRHQRSAADSGQPDQHAHGKSEQHHLWFDAQHQLNAMPRRRRPLRPPPGRRAGRTRSSRCRPSGPRGRCPGACRARSRSTRSPGRAAGCRAGRARGSRCHRSFSLQWASGLYLIRPRLASLFDRLGASARVGPCSRLMPVIQPSAPSSARSSAATLATEQQCSGPVQAPSARPGRLRPAPPRDAEALLEALPRLQASRGTARPCRS